MPETKEDNSPKLLTGMALISYALSNGVKVHFVLGEGKIYLSQSWPREGDVAVPLQDLELVIKQFHKQYGDRC